MVSFDSVPPDRAVITAVPASVFRYVQTVAPSALYVFALVVYVMSMIFASHVHSRIIHAILMVVMLCVLMASLLKRIAPFVFIEVGHYRYERVSMTITRLLPVTYESCIAVQTLAVVAVGHPLCLYIFTHYTANGNLYAFAMFGLAGSLAGPLFSLCVGILICVGLLGALFAMVHLPDKGYEKLHIHIPEDRVRTWIQLSSWFPLTLLLMVLFCVVRLLPCDGAHESYTATSPPYTCGSGAHWFGSIFAWLLIALSFASLDVSIGFLRLLGDKDVLYYALDARLDGLFCELLVWVLKATVAATVVLAPVTVYAITAALFLGLFAFASHRHTATSEVLEEIIRWAMSVVMVTCAVSCLVSLGSISALAQGLLILLGWLLSVGYGVVLYHRRFGWELFGNGSGITADLIVV
ncbi:hypothetical protein, conserved [Leishmania tarentolae]|uniref:Transmembrane protein n=1 Tax=Leishmania tarentolae TaxID=5689 RepID=A0A640KX21_LEITA|nr:hypothetical protein, conserved [Leishmania tarentolae]